jgi:hypothetical protein
VPGIRRRPAGLAQHQRHAANARSLMPPMYASEIPIASSGSRNRLSSMNGFLMAESALASRAADTLTDH